MSVNLVIGFDRHRLPGAILCHERMRLDWQDYDAFDKLNEQAIPLPDGVMWYDDDGLHTRLADCYDNPLKWLPAFQFAKHMTTAESHLTDWDKAALAFIKALRPDTKIVLYWS